MDPLKSFTHLGKISSTIRLISRYAFRAVSLSSFFTSLPPFTLRGAPLAVVFARIVGRDNQERALGGTSNPSEDDLIRQRRVSRHAKHVFRRWRQPHPKLRAMFVKISTVDSANADVPELDILAERFSTEHAPRLTRVNHVPQSTHPPRTHARNSPSRLTRASAHSALHSPTILPTLHAFRRPSCGSALSLAIAWILLGVGCPEWLWARAFDGVPGCRGLVERVGWQSGTTRCGLWPRTLRILCRT
ncbi:hypothetical protein LXA43DRAFT_1099951 [Ganoderma leucocontextum]|nr:hypothetical protein LXA43DRAFT_1099951 [Ganoderma leucocontextum]